MSVQTGVNGAGGVLTFTTDFTPDTVDTNYIVLATVSNLAPGDSTTFSVTAADIDLSAAVPEPGTIANALHAQDPASCSPAFNYFTNALDVTPGVANSWQDVDVSGSVPAGATGVIVQWNHGDSGGTDYDYGVRKKGSTDTFFPGAAKNQQQHWLMVGLDANRVFQVYQGNTTAVKTWLIGYTMSGVTFLDNRIDKSLGASGAWIDVNISADTGADTAIGAIFVVNNTASSSRMFGLRKNGSSDNRVTALRADTVTAGIIGVDGSEIAEMNIEDTSVDLYLVGYVTSGAVFFTDAVNKSTGTTGSYVDVDITSDIGADDANGAIVEISPSDNTRRLAALRMNGATYDLYEDVSHGYTAIGIDAGNLFEQKIENTTMDLYLVGYSLGSCAGATPTTNYRSIGTASDTTTGDVSATNGSTIVVGNGTSWQAANRGQGDRIDIDGTDYTIFAVDTDAQITLTGPFSGVTGVGKSYTISRQFGTLQAWENCISGAGGCTYFPVVGGNLVVEDRREIGIAYDETTFTDNLVFEDSITDVDRFITLTAGDGNRHYGLAGGGVLLDPAGSGHAITVKDNYTRIEWLEITGWTGAGSEGVRMDADFTVYAYMLVHGGVDTQSDGFFMPPSNGSWTATIRNTIVYNVPRAGINLQNASGTETLVLNLENVTAYNNGSPTAFPSDESAGVSMCESLGASSTINATNVLSVGNFDADFDLAADFAVSTRASCNGAPSWGSSAFNLDSDGTAPGASPVNSSVGAVMFVSTTPGSEDLHIQSGSSAGDVGVDLSGSFAADIDGALRQTPWDIGADDIAATTEVALISFAATALDGAVELSWETGSELDNLGFHVYRSSSAAGPYQRVTARPIPGLGNSPVGARYSYRDQDLVNGTTYFYRLEDIETTGRTEMHGPVSATPAVGATLPVEERSAAEASGATTRVTYGDPKANTLRVLREGRNFIELELRTEGFYAIPQEDGTVVLEIPGFDLVGQAGSPSIPAKHHWIDAVAGRKVELGKVRGRMEPVTASWSVASETLELVANTTGTVTARRRRRRTSVNAKGLFPAQAAKLVMVGYQGESKKALVELAPVRFRSDTGQLFLAKRLVVRLSFRSIDRAELTLAGRGGRRRARKFDRTHGVLMRLATVERGLYGVRYESLFGKGRGLRTRELRLTRQGSSVAFHVEPNPARFGPGSTMYFLSDGADVNPYGNEAVFELSMAGKNQPSLQMASASDVAAGSATAFYWKTVDHEVNRYYQPALLDAPDLWLWDLLLAPVTTSYPFQVTSLADSVEPARVEVALQGTSDTPAAFDHHVRLYINGTFLEEASWNGKAPRQLTADIGPGLLLEGDNVLEIENVGDTEASYSAVMLDRFRVVYPRELIAEAGELSGAWSESGTAAIAGVGSTPIVLDMGELGEPSPPRWLDVNRASFTVEAGRSYLIVDESAVRVPEIRRPSLAFLTSTRNQADYIVVGPRTFVEAAAPLLAHRAEQGLVSMAVAIEDVFHEFGRGESRPEAIRDFLSYAYHEWKAPSPRYVVLLGDASYDYKDYGQLGVSNPVPPLIVKTSYLWTVSDPTLAAVNGDDILPDFAIGRLPAGSVDEVRAMVSKILAWESAEYGLDNTAVLVADDPARAGNFAPTPSPRPRACLER